MNDHYAQSPGALSETVVSALISASDEISAKETWAASRLSGASALVPRIIGLIVTAPKMLRRDHSARIYIRQNILKVLAYLPADLRLGCLIDMAGRNPEALDDIFSGHIAEDYEIYRYNVISSLGIFARHGLVEEVFTAERIRAVGQSVRETHRRAAMKQRGK